MTCSRENAAHDGCQQYIGTPIRRLSVGLNSNDRDSRSLDHPLNGIETQREQELSKTEAANRLKRQGPTGPKRRLSDRVIFGRSVPQLCPVQLDRRHPLSIGPRETGDGRIAVVLNALFVPSGASDSASSGVVGAHGCTAHLCPEWPSASDGSLIGVKAHRFALGEIWGV